MPQLDLLTFFTQFFWAVLCLFVFYFFVSKLILPELTRVLKYRTKASALSTSDDRAGLAIHANSQKGEQGVSSSFSRPKSGSSALYQYSCGSSIRLLAEAQQRKETFLNQISTGTKR